MSMPKMVIIFSKLPHQFYPAELFIILNVYKCAEHFKPLFEHIGKLEEALYNIQFEQHWLEAQTDRQAVGNWAACYILIKINLWLYT